MIEKAQRDIDIIASDLQTALKGEVADILAIGNLLLEAKDQLEHGEWLPWLKLNFGASTRSAQNYMAAARFAAKYATVAHLKLRPTALYWLSDDLTSREEIEAIFKVAETEWVDYDRAFDIANSLNEELTDDSDDEAAEEAREQAAEAARTEAEEILAGPPPELQPAPEPTPINRPLQEFDAAVAALHLLQTKPRATFAATTHDLKVINAVQKFLRLVAEQLES